MLSTTHVGAPQVAALSLDQAGEDSRQDAGSRGSGRSSASLSVNGSASAKKRGGSGRVRSATMQPDTQRSAQNDSLDQNPDTQQSVQNNTATEPSDQNLDSQQSRNNDIETDQNVDTHRSGNGDLNEGGMNETEQDSTVGQKSGTQDGQEEDDGERVSADNQNDTSKLDSEQNAQTNIELHGVELVDLASLSLEDQAMQLVNSYSKELSPEQLNEFVTKLVNILKSTKKFDTQYVLELMKKIGRIYFDYTEYRLKLGELLVELGFVEHFVVMYKYYNSMGVFSSDAVWFPTYYLLNSTWNISDASNHFCERIVSSGVLKLVHANITHKPYLENQSSKNVLYILKSSLSILQNVLSSVSNRAENFKPVFEQLNIKEAVMPFIDNQQMMLKTLAIMILSKLLSEEENKQFEDSGVITYITDAVRKALSSEKRRCHGFVPTELVDTLGRIAINDNNKKKIVENGALKSLTLMMKHNDPEEHYVAARTIWTLSFDPDAKRAIIHEPGCMDALHTLSTSDHKGARKMAEGALWKLNEEENKKDAATVERAKSAKPGQEQHIFISYNWDHKDMVHKVKDRLKAEGHRVWIDVEQMGGSTLEAMAHAVENASVVLVCLSEKYKQSPNCRTEAEYTFQLKKPIIPLMLQRRYKPDGWLGMLCGAKMYINFDGKYEFDHAYDILKRELGGQKEPPPSAHDVPDGGTDEVPKKTDISVPPQDDAAVVMATAVPMLQKAPAVAPAHSTEAAFVTWTEDEVKQWVEKSGLSACQAVLGRMDGKKLLMFCHLRQEAPEFFYNSLTTKYGLDLMDIMQLMQEMNNLK